MAAAFAILTFLAALGAALAYVNLRKAEAATAAAAKAKDFATRSAHQAQLRALEATIAAADASLRLDDPASGRRLLDTVRPTDRQWEWFWLDGRVDSSVATFSNSFGSPQLRYDPNRQRLLLFEQNLVHEYAAPTWKPLGTTTAREPGDTTPGSASARRYRGIAGRDAAGRRFACALGLGESPKAPQGPQLAVLDLQPAPHWVELEAPAEGWAESDGLGTFSPNGTLLALAYPQGGVSEGSPAERVVCLWDTSTGKIRHSLKPRSGKVMAVAFTPDGRTIATACVQPSSNFRNHSPTLFFWDVESGTLLNSFVTANSLDLVFSPDGRTAYAAQSYGQFSRFPGTVPREGSECMFLLPEQIHGLLLSPPRVIFSLSAATTATSSSSTQLLAP